MSFDGNSEAGTTIAPLTMPPGRSFAIVARIRFETEQGSCPSFGLLVRSHVPLSTRDNLGVLGTVQTGSYDWCPHGLGISYVSPFWDGERTSFNNFAWADFQPGSSWHTYRLEVRGARLQFLVDHQLLASGLSNAYYYSGRIGVFAGNAAIMVRSFRVYTLP